VPRLQSQQRGSNVMGKQNIKRAFCEGEAELIATDINGDKIERYIKDLLALNPGRISCNE